MRNLRLYCCGRITFLDVDGRVILVVVRSSRFRAGNVGGSVQEYIIFESQLTG